jgi:hypothetical protein
MTASYLPLLAIQQRSHSRIYAIPARELGSTSEILAASQEVRQRLRGVVLGLPKPKAAAKPEMHVVPWPETPIVELVHEALLESAPLDMHAPCSWKFLVKVAALQHGQTSKDVLGRGRTPPVIKARHLAMHLVATHTVTNATRIGHKFGRDHATVLYALGKFPQVEREHVSPLVHVEPIKSARTPPEKAAIIVRGFAQGVPRKQIAEQIGMSLASVKGFAYRHGLKHAKRPYYARHGEAQA